MKRTIVAASLLAVLLLAVSGCASVPDPSSIPPETTVADLSQSGQEALDDNNYKAAEVYYQLIIDRYGSDPKALTAAEFEIAHLRIKTKKWADARTRLETIIARYESTGGAGLPPEYLVLAKNDLKKIPAEAPAIVDAPAIVEAPATDAPTTKAPAPEAPAAEEPATEKPSDSGSTAE